MKKFVFALALVALVGAAAPASAAIYGVPDATPAATLLVPYFEVDLDDPNGVTTLFSVNNASATAILTHVTFWSDWSQHTLDFMIYLTGYDVQTINIRDVFDGDLPVTASAGQDPGDTISPQGLFSQDINFASCNGILPYTNPALPAFNLDLIRLGHTGQPIPDYGNRCVGADHGDNVARGYVTIDTVNSCTLLFPADPGYFVDGGGGIATNQNTIWGDFFLIDPVNNFAFGDNLVHIEARPSFSTLPTLPNPLNYTFYGRYDGGTGQDDREPLGTVWATRFLNGGVFDGGTDLIVWRDSTVDNQPVNGFSCATGPNWVPLIQNELVYFDEEEQPLLPEGCEISPCPPNLVPIPFPIETQRVPVGVGELATPYDFGWIYLDLNLFGEGAPTGDVDFGGNPALAQSYVLSSHSALGRFQVGYPAIALRLAINDVNAGSFQFGFF